MSQRDVFADINDKNGFEHGIKINNKSEEKKDDNKTTIAHGPYDNLLNLIYKTCMNFIESYNEFPWKMKHNERLTNLNQMYNELRIAEDRWKQYYKKHIDDIPADIEINMTREIRKIIRSIQRYKDINNQDDEKEIYISDDNDDAYLSDGELRVLNRKIKAINKKKNIKRARKKQYEEMKDEDITPDDIIIDEEIIERQKRMTSGDDIDSDDDMDSDDEVIVEVDLYDTDSVISEENLRNKLNVYGNGIQSTERLYKLTEEKIMYTDNICKQWNEFISKYNENIERLEQLDKGRTDDGEDDRKESDILEAKIKRKYSIGSFPLLHQFVNLRRRIERVITNEINTVNNLDRFVHVMINRIFNKCNELSINGLIEFVFKRLEDVDKRPNKSQFGDLKYDFQKNLYEERCTHWLYYWHSTMRRIMEYSTKRDRVLQENGYLLMQKLIDRYILAVHSVRNKSRILNCLNTMKINVGNRGKNLSNVSLVSYTIQCLRRRRVNDDIIISKEKAIEMLKYYLDLPNKILNIPDKISKDKTLRDDEYDNWRIEVYKIYGNILKEMVRFREIVIGIRVNKKRFEKMDKIDQEILEEDIEQSTIYIQMIYDIWSKHLLTHMHAQWNDADQEMQKLYIMMKRNYKSISKLAQIHEKQIKIKEEKELQEQREKEEEEYQKRLTQKGVKKDKDGTRKTKVKKKILKRRTKAEREHFIGSSRLLRGLKSIEFRVPKSPMDMKKLRKEWIKFVNKYIDDIDKIDEETGRLTDTENIKFKYVESIHATEFQRIFKQITNCVSSLNNVLINRDIEYMNHIRSIMKHLTFTPKLIGDIISNLVPGMLDINKYIEHTQLRSQSIEVINEAFAILETKRRQIAHTPELKAKLAPLDSIICELFSSSYKQVMDAAYNILQKKIDDLDETPLEEDGATFDDMQDEYLLLAVKILQYCPTDQFKEAFNQILINNELVEHIVDLMKKLNKRKQYESWQVCWRGIMGVKDDLINPDRSKHTPGIYTSPPKGRRQ
eukprot:84967_1